MVGKEKAVLGVCSNLDMNYNVHLFYLKYVYLGVNLCDNLRAHVSCPVRQHW